MSNFFDALTGSDAADASRDAARSQERTGREAIDFQRDLSNRLIDLQDPFRRLGTTNIQALARRVGEGSNVSDLSTIRSRVGQPNEALNRLTSLTTDPNAQANFIQNNPFFNALADDAQSRIFSNQAARGKLGSGETAEGLQNALVRLGGDLLSREVSNLQGTAGLTADVNQQDIGNLFGLFGAEQGASQTGINNLFNLVGIGQNAASLQGNSLTGAGNQITDLMTGIGNARASGLIGAANARAQGAQNIVNLGAAIASDRRVKDILEKVGKWTSQKTKNVYDTYLYKYKGMEDLFIGVMADEVEKVNPKAVAEHGGIKFVYYEAL